MNRSIRSVARTILALSIALLFPVAALAGSSVGQRAFNPQPEPPKGKAQANPGTGQASSKGIIIVNSRTPKSAK